MTSQPADSSSKVEIPPFVRGYHAYKDIWTPSVGDCLSLMHEETNTQDKNAVAVILSNKL